MGTPTNPLMRVLDIRAVAEVARAPAPGRPTAGGPLGRKVTGVRSVRMPRRLNLLGKGAGRHPHTRAAKNQIIPISP